MKRNKVIFTKKEMRELMDRLKAEQQEMEREYESIEEKQERHKREDYDEDERY